MTEKVRYQMLAGLSRLSGWVLLPAFALALTILIFILSRGL